MITAPPRNHGALSGAKLILGSKTHRFAAKYNPATKIVCRNEMETPNIGIELIEPRKIMTQQSKCMATDHDPKHISSCNVKTMQTQK